MTQFWESTIKNIICQQTKADAKDLKPRLESAQKFAPKYIVANLMPIF